MNHKIVWQGDEGHIEGFVGSVERIHHKPAGWSFMVSTPERTYRHVSESYSTRSEMEAQAIRYLINKGELA
jgi:carbamate kinase